jgi:hypothetical protein
MFVALTSRRELDIRQEDRRAALICATLANRFRTQKEQAYRIEDFMPHKVVKKDPQELWLKAQMITMAFRGGTKHG